MRVPYAKVDCSGNELEYVSEVLNSGWLTTASKTKLLEDNVKKYVGAKYALAVNSCTSGLHLALDALDVKPGDKIFVPSLTFTASAEVIRYMGADPVLIDVDYSSGCMTVEHLQAAIEAHPEVKVLIAVHFSGLVLPMLSSEDKVGILDLCADAGIRIVEDAAHALPTKQGDRFVGSFGDITCFSFYANKTMTTGEGGMITTNNEDYAQRMSLMRLHGIDRDVWNRFTSKNSAWEYDVVAPGYKYNMPDLNAAVGLAQFERLEEMHAARTRVAELYFHRFQGMAQIDLPYRPDTMLDHSWHLFPIKVNSHSTLNRNQVIAAMTEAGIGTSVHYKPLHQLKYYKDRYDLKAVDYPNAEAIWQSTLSLPIYNLLTQDNIDYICDALEGVFRCNYSAV